MQDEVGGYFEKINMAADINEKRLSDGGHSQKVIS